MFVRGLHVNTCLIVNKTEQQISPLLQRQQHAEVSSTLNEQ